MRESILWAALKFRAAFFIIFIKMPMAVSRRYRHVSIGQQTVIKKILPHTAEYSAHEYELYALLICLDNSYYSNAPAVLSAWAFAVIAPYWGERG